MFYYICGAPLEAEPLLALCGGLWKADQLVGRHLYWLAEQAKKEGKEAGQKRSFNAEGDLDFDEEWGDQTSVDASAKTDTASSSAPRKKRKAATMAMGKGKDKENQDVAPGPPSRPISTPTVPLPIAIENELTTLGQPSLPPLPPTVDDDNITQNNVQPNVDAAFDSFKTQMQPPDIGRSHEPLLDVTFIQIEKTLSSLRREFSTDFPNMTTVTNLFDAMEANPQFGNTTPSTAMLHFIEAIETADPNSPDFSEDDTNAQWGHKQLSGTWKGILTGWDAIVNHTWELWKAAGGPILKGKGKESPVLNASNTTATPAMTSTPSTSLASSLESDAVAAGMTPTRNEVDHRNEVEKSLRKLTKEQLKDILDAHSIKTTSRKNQPTKPELVADILNASISSDNTIFAEVQSRLDKRLPRSRNKASKDA
ncbi:hypothetical protein BJ912DRAFT_934137 [Pholiota molesta]|nr:hypothetical protein BJ912DRAFT_934137 [Pholiota molesta]